MLKKIYRGAGLLLFGTVSGQVIVLACSPLITRLYAPSDFGAFAVYVALLYAFSSAASLRNEVAISVAPSDEKAEHLTVASFYILVVYTLMLFVAAGPLVQFFHVEALTKYWYMLPIGVFALGMYNISVYVGLRTSKHGLIAKTKCIQAASGAGVQITLGFLGAGAIGLVLGQLFSVAGGITKLLPLRLLVKKIAKTSLHDAKMSFKDNISFAKYDAPAAFLAVANNQVPTLIIASFFGSFAIGMYALVQRIVLMPLTLVATSISGSLLSDARHMTLGTMHVVAKKIALISCGLAPLFVCAAILAPAVFGRIFGHNWAAAGEVAAWIALMASQKFNFDAISIMLSAKERQSVLLKLQILLVASRILVLISCSVFLSLSICIMLFSLVSAIGYSTATWFVQRQLGPEGVLVLIMKCLEICVTFALIEAAQRYGFAAPEFIGLLCIYLIYTVVRLVSAFRQRKASATVVTA